MIPARADRMQTAIWAAVGLALLALFYALGPILTPFAIAAVFAYICDPAVNWLVARKVPRALAVLGVIIGLGALLALLMLMLVPAIYREAVVMIARFPELLEMLNNRLLPWLGQRLGTELTLDTASLKGWMGEYRETAQDMLPALLERAREGGLVLIAFVANLALIPIVMFYLLQEWPRILTALQTVIPRPMLPRTMRILSDIDKVLSEFLRGQLSVMLLLAVFYSIGLWIAGLKFALPVGVITGLLAFIPFVGFGGGLVLAVLAALLQAEGWPLLIGVAVVFGIGQLLESYLLTPYLVGERIGLHPLAVIFSLMAFGQLFGFVGMLVALPASAAILVGLRELRSAWFASPIYLGARQSETEQDQ
ncbi:MAG TPA: AI-2E family transporter [Azoarcus taiwanensis]|nr:AI-2E family transporter [Azoarcus taiwanensis]